jgi:hypothetical protein
MGPMIKFLQAVRRLAQLGVKKEDIIEFGKREFGEMTELLSKQVDDIYKRFYKDKGGSIFKDKKPESGTKKSAEVMTAQSFSDIGKILEREKIVDMQPRKGLDVSKSDELEKITKFDETDRKPNAEGGLNYLMGL